MGSESFHSNYNSFKSDSDSSSNSGNKNDKLEKINLIQENENTIIKRVWIVKKSITIHDRHITEKRTCILDYIPYSSYVKRVRLI